MRTTQFLVGATPAGGLILPVAPATEGGLEGFRILSVTGPSVTIEQSADGVEWLPANVPFTALAGFLRLTRMDTTATASAINGEVLPLIDGSPYQALPTAGTSQVLTMSANTGLWFQFVLPTTGRIFAKTYDGTGEVAMFLFQQPLPGAPLTFVQAADEGTAALELSAPGQPAGTYFLSLIARAELRSVSLFTSVYS